MAGRRRGFFTSAKATDPLAKVAKAATYAIDDVAMLLEVEHSSRATATQIAGSAGSEVALDASTEAALVRASRERRILALALIAA